MDYWIGIIHNEQVPRSTFVLYTTTMMTTYNLSRATGSLMIKTMMRLLIPHQGCLLPTLRVTCDCRY